LSRLRSTQRSKEVIGRFRSLDLFVQFLNFSALSVDLLSFLHRQLTVFGLGFLRKVAGSLQRGVALFHVCSHYKSPFIAIMLIVASARSGRPPDVARSSTAACCSGFTGSSQESLTHLFSSACLSSSLSTSSSPGSSSDDRSNSFKE